MHLANQFNATRVQRYVIIVYLSKSNSAKSCSLYHECQATQTTRKITQNMIIWQNVLHDWLQPWTHNMRQLQWCHSTSAALTEEHTVWFRTADRLTIRHLSSRPFHFVLLNHWVIGGNKWWCSPVDRTTAVWTCIRVGSGFLHSVSAHTPSVQIPDAAFHIFVFFIVFFFSPCVLFF